MDYFRLTAPCGLDCFHCDFFLAHEDGSAMERVKELSREHQIPVETMLCRGCRDQDGQIPLQLHVFGEKHRCAAYECAKAKGVGFCSECENFPCDHLHPYADMATELPHNIKVFNLCLIKKMGLKVWAETKAGKVREDYFQAPWKLG